MTKQLNKNQPRIAICPGTFDPITYGHLDLIERAIEIFDQVIVAVSQNVGKEPLFSLEERMDMIRVAVKDRPQVLVENFTGLVVDYASKRNSRALVRGVRMLSDFEYEFQMALTNRKLNSNVETIFLMPNESYSYLTSSLIKEIASMSGKVNDYVPEHVADAIYKKFEKK
ncbi:MAG: pantetheine-phosphate adenylyltransferase [Candidatus Omnitrophota bacterium]|jgi:pantetheine-phosphate adenylyltransferase